MKKNNILKIILSIFILAGVAGAAAALTKGFKEIPEFVLNETETIEHHEEQHSSGGSDVESEEEIKPSDVDNVVDSQVTYYAKNQANHTGWSQEMTKIPDSNYFYEYEPVSNTNENVKWGIQAKFLLTNGSFKNLNCGITIKNNHIDSCSYSYPENNVANFHLICFSFNGSEPDISSIASDDYFVINTIDTEIDSKIFVYSCSVPQYHDQKITVTLEGDEYSQEESYQHILKNEYAYLSFNQIDDLDSVDININIIEYYSNNVSYSHDFDRTLNFDKKYKKLTIVCSNNEDNSSFTDYDDFIIKYVLEDGEFKCNLWIYGFLADDPENPLPEEGYNYVIKLSKNQLLNTPVLPPRSGNTYDLIIESLSDVNYTLRKIVILKTNNVPYDAWNGTINDSELYISISPNEDYFEFGGFTFADNTSISVPIEEINYYVELYLTINENGEKSNYTDLFISSFELYEREDLSPGTYTVSITRDQIESICNENGEFRLIDNALGDEEYWLITAESTYENQRIDYWDGGIECNNLCPTSNYLEISLNGNPEISIDTGSGEWYLDGFIAPSNINWTLNLVIKINSITDINNYSKLFLTNVWQENQITRQFNKVTSINSLSVGSKVIIGTNEDAVESYGKGAILNISSNPSDVSTTIINTTNKVFEKNYELFGTLLEVKAVNKNTGDITFKIPRTFYSQEKCLKMMPPESQYTSSYPDWDHEATTFKFKQNSLCINENNNSTWLGYGYWGSTFSFAETVGTNGNAPYNAVNLYILSNGNNEYEIINDTVDDSTFENNREYVINPNLNASNIGRLTQNGTLTWRKRDKNTLEILDEKTNLDSFEVVGNDNPKHIQCKKNGSNVVEGTLVNFDTYADADYYITIEFNSSYNKSGYYQYIVFNSILGYIE